MATIQVSATDIARLKIILSAMKKGKWELEGEEVLAFAQGFNWLAETHEKINAALQTKPPAEEKTVEGKFEPKPIVRKGKK
jgi:hypothetical protein